MADPDLQVEGGGSHPDPEITGGSLKKKLFSTLQASVWSKNNTTYLIFACFFLFHENSKALLVKFL